MKKTNLICVLLSLLTFSGLTHAEFYVGGNYGISEIEYSDVKDGSAYKVFAGYMFNNNIAIDIAYLDSGTMDIDLSNTIFQRNNVYLQFEGMSYSVAYFIKAPETQSWYMSVKGGLYDIKSKLKNRDTGIQITDSSTGIGWD